MPSKPRPVVTFGAGSIVGDAHYPAYRKSGVPIAGPGTTQQGVGRYNCDGTYSFYGPTAATDRTAINGESDPGRWASIKVPAQFDPAALFGGAKRLAGLMVGSRAMTGDLSRFVEDKRLRPVIDRVFPFAHARDAYRHLAQGRHFGKVVIVG